MELRVLRYFLAVAREENITKAAALLHVTQPTLSRQLMQLEEELGVKLFRRSQYRVVLTDDGMLLRRRAQEIVELADKAERELQHLDTELTGEIAIGCGESVGMTFLSEHIRAFRRLHRQVQFRIYSANADDVKERIEKGLLDMGLLTEPVDIGRYAFLRTPQKATVGAYCCQRSIRWHRKARSRRTICWVFRFFLAAAKASATSLRGGSAIHTTKSKLQPHLT